MANYKLILEYDGTAYNGFQIQNNGITIQEVLESALAKLAKEPVKVISAGRTDAGVHALAQVVSFRSGLTVPVDRLPLALNSLLPPDIRVKSCEIVPDHFHAQYSAVAKTYLYRIRQGASAPVFERHYCWWIRRPLNREAMLEAGKLLEGTHDFAAFTASGSSVKSTVRTLFRYGQADVEGGLDLRFTADGFLYKMVRNMVGTLVEIGLGKRRAADIPAVIASKNRDCAGVTAPASGLFLERVWYEHPAGLDDA